MTTPAAARLYEAQHQAQWNGRSVAIFNPHSKPVPELPVIYGFNNGGSPGWFSACLIAEDGTGLGSHLCSAESYMPADLGILEGSQSDRHETFRAHYPDGYRMEFVPYADVDGHAGIKAAFAEAEAQEDQPTPSNPVGGKG